MAHKPQVSPRDTDAISQVAFYAEARHHDRHIDDSATSILLFPLVAIAAVADLTRPSQRTKAMAIIGSTIGVVFALSFVLAPFLRHAIVGTCLRCDLRLGGLRASELYAGLGAIRRRAISLPASPR